MPLSENLTINGIALSTAIPGAHVLDVLIGAVEYEHYSTARIKSVGSLFSHKHDGVRKITIKIELPINKQEDCLIHYSALRAWAEYEQPVQVYLPVNAREYGDTYINCILTSISDLDVRRWYEPIELVFTAYDPYFYGGSFLVQCGETFTVSNGNAPPKYSIYASLKQAQNGVYWSLDGKATITLNGLIGVGGLQVDPDTGLISLSGNSINHLLALDSRFFEISIGEQHVFSGTCGHLSYIVRWK